jgi:hypothetical protein
MGQCQDSTRFVRLVTKFHEALISDDYKTIKKLLSRDIQYTHSNGWIESREEVVKNLKTNYIIYHTISMDSIKTQFTADSVVVEFLSKVTLTLKEKPISIGLHVLQHWNYKNGKYKMTARKSVKIN